MAAGNAFRRHVLAAAHVHRGKHCLSQIQACARGTKGNPVIERRLSSSFALFPPSETPFATMARNAVPLQQVRNMAGLGGERHMNTPKHFVDLSRIRVQGGRGGNGCLSYARDNRTRWGGPDGGSGGDGGNVWVEATTSLQDLSRDKYTYQGGDGKHGKPSGCDGAKGRDVVVFVPVGTLVRKMPASEEGDGRAEEQGEAGMTAISDLINDPSRKKKKKATPRGHRRPKLYKNKRAKKEAQKAERLRLQEEGDEGEEEEDWMAEEEEWGEEEEDGGGEEAGAEMQGGEERQGGGSKRGRERRWGVQRYEDEDDEAFVARRMRELKAHPELEWDGNRLNVANVSMEELQNLIFFGNREGAGAGVEEEEELLADLDREGQRVLVASGGVGGRGNVALSSKQERAPSIAESGGQGARYRIELELKSIADFGLIGYPNAGKSSLLRALSNAHPKVASYPFTTMRPHIGVVEDLDGIETMSVADLPGLVDGAHDDVGLGHSFLRHVERTRGLVFVIDVSLETRESNPYRDLQALRRELELYLPSLSRRTAVVLANKMDLPLAEEGLGMLAQGLRTLSAVSPQDSLADAPIIPISAQRKTNIDQVVKTLFSVLEEARRAPLDPETGTRYAWT